MLLVPVVGEKKTVVSLLMLSLLMLTFISSVVFGSSADWVEVDRFMGGSWNGGTRPFLIDYDEWRIRWNYEPVSDIDEETPVLFRFLVLDTGNNHVEFIVGDEITKGTSMLFQQGTFYLFIMDTMFRITLSLLNKT